MLETNIRIVRPGCDLYVWARYATVQGPDLSLDLLERACGRLRHGYGLAAVSSAGRQPGLLVATKRPIPAVRLEGEEWVLDVTDSGASTRRLALADPDGPALLPSLIERALLVELRKRTDFWTLDSPRIWYEARPFRTESGIAAYRRFEVASLPIDGIGVGVAVDIGTAFLTTATLDFFFDAGVSSDERGRRRRLFAALTARQAGQKGTLLYDNGRSKVKCYFEDAPEGVTCGNTGKMRLKGKTYDSLFKYYRSEVRDLPVTEETPAVRVSFPGLDRPQWVAANRVWVRVMNENVPESLSAVDKIPPNDRRHLLQGFWDRLEPDPLSRVAPGFHKGFWQPDSDRWTRLIQVGLEFGQGHRVPPPATASAVAYRNYYRSRLEHLENAGCYFVPPTAGRTLYCACPRHLGREVAQQLGDDIAAKISKWAGLSFDRLVVEYDAVAQAIEELRRAEQAGTAVFVLDEEPVAYHEVQFQLPDWRIKRITERVLHQHYRFRTEGAWDKKRRSYTHERGRSRWDQFITMNALDVMQQMDIVPYRIEQAGPYEAQLAIDVSHDRRHFALSLLIARPADKKPSFLIRSEVVVKIDHKREAVNSVVLADQIVGLFQNALRERFDPIASLLALRDGRLCGEEPQGIDRAIATLVEQGLLRADARVDVVEFHKDSLKSVRVWEVTANGDAVNPLEGTALYLTERMAVVATTGSATLHQGTAQPFMLVANGRCVSIMDVAIASFAAAQLNWSSPAVAQRLPLQFKRTDEELTTRSAQEIRRIR